MPCLRATIATDTPGSILSATIWRFCWVVQQRRLPQVRNSMPRSPALVRSIIRASSACDARFAMPSCSVNDDIWH
jgi:hypothetical protein